MVVNNPNSNRFCICGDGAMQKVDCKSCQTDIYRVEIGTTKLDDS